MYEKIETMLLSKTLKVLLKIAPPKTPTLFQGEGSITELAEYIKAEGHHHILVVTTPGMRKKNLLEQLESDLSKLQLNYSFFEDVQPNPTIKTVENLIGVFHHNKCDGIIAFGGGSVIDASKAAAYQIGNNKPLRELIGNFKGKKNPVSLYTIPTTSGTGSEVTSASVLMNDENQKSFIFDHKLVSKGIALDPAPLLGLPPVITADTGMDALTHAVEAYISRNDDPAMLEKAAKAVELIFANLKETYANGSNTNAREEMSHASYLAGEAFNHMGLGFVHAISHQMTAWYNIPHGRANAIILPHVLRKSFHRIYPKLAKLAKESNVVQIELNDEQAAKNFIDRIETLLADLNFPKNFTEIKDKDIPSIVKGAKVEAQKAHPVLYILSNNEIESILKELK